MTGFFSNKQLQSISRPGGKTCSCVSCGMYKTAKTPRMKPYGNFKKGILNIGEAPGKVEDQRGLPWQGKSGQELKKVYRSLGVDLFEDCLNLNACHCRPVDKEGNDCKPSDYQVECCRKETFRIINEYKPKVVVLLGERAIFSVIGYLWKKGLGGIGRWRGWTIPDQDLKTWLCPVFHPRYVLRRDEPVVDVIWKQDLERALSKLDEPLQQYQEPVINYIDDLSVFDSMDKGVIAFDYETTGLKPHAVGHRIVCAAVATDENTVYSFIMPKTRRGREPFVNLLKNPAVKKMAHNLKFEHNWSQIRLNVEVDRWDWDSMLFAHILDNRRGITGLKFQTYINFGISDYSSDIDQYLRGVGDGSNAFNTVKQLIEMPNGKERLLKYCALDAVYEYRLAMLQQKLINYESR